MENAISIHKSHVGGVIVGEKRFSTPLLDDIHSYRLWSRVCTSLTRVFLEIIPIHRHMLMVKRH